MKRWLWLVALVALTITPAFEEQIEGRTYLVQYFERRRMEYHPENAGTSYDILLGLLGRAVAQSQGCVPLQDRILQRIVNQYRPSLGCPNAAVREFLPAAIQPFEHGWMLWIDGTSSAPPMIFAIYPTPSGMRYRWQSFTDTYREGELVGGAENPPAGRVAPVRGFGKIWWNTPDLRTTLGWATEPEHNDTGSALFYNNGGWMVHLVGEKPVFVMQSGGFANIELP